MNQKKLYVLLDFLILTALSAFFINLYWQKWTNPIIDFGREVYIPWRINNGQILYKDLAFLFGAFPPYWNALLFKIFGSSILTLCVFNTFISLLNTALIYRFFYTTCNRLAALMTGIIFLCLFVFNHPPMMKNMYYLAPYSHSNFYAIFFGLFAINILQIYVTNPRKRVLPFLGFFLGLMLLSRLEIFVSFFIALLIGLSLFFWKQHYSAKQILLSAGLFLSSLILPVFIFVAYFAQYFSWPQALLNVIGYNSQWMRIQDIYIYKSLAGFINWPIRLRTVGIIILWYGFYALAFSLFCSGIILLRRGQKNFAAAARIAFFTIFIAYSTHRLLLQPSSVFLGHIVFLLFFGFHAIYNFRKSKYVNEWANHLLVIVFCIWAILMLYKVPLQASIFNYGFIYALPGILLSIAYLTHVFPAKTQEKYQLGWAANSFTVTLLIIICLTTAELSIRWASHKNIQIGKNNDQLWTYSTQLPKSPGQNINNFLAWAQNHIGPQEKFTTFPNGTMLNFLTKRQIAGPHTSYMEAEIVTFGEEVMLQSLIDEPPDYIVFINSKMVIHNNIVMGKNYALKIFSWVMSHYSSVWRTGGKLGDPKFGIEVLKRNHADD